MRFQELLESRGREIFGWQPNALKTPFSRKIERYETRKGNVYYRFEHEEKGVVVVLKYVWRRNDFEIDWDISMDWSPEEKPTLGEVIREAAFLVKDRGYKDSLDFFE